MFSMVVSINYKYNYRKHVFKIIHFQGRMYRRNTLVNIIETILNS